MLHRGLPTVAACLGLAIIFTVGASRYLGQRRQHSSQPKMAEMPTQSIPAAASEAPPESVGCKVHSYTGSVPLNQVEYYSAGEEDLRGGMTCTFRIGSKLPLFSFEFAGKPDNTFGDLVIRQGIPGKVVQTIENETAAAAIAPAHVADVLAIVDANFDGYGDLQILNNCGATGNCSYDFYLYDPQANQFVHSDFLSKLGTPSFDPGRKRVMTSWNSSAADWQSETYQYQEGQYTLIRQELSEWDRNSDIVTVSTFELRNGKMELVGSDSHHF